MSRLVLTAAVCGALALASCGGSGTNAAAACPPRVAAVLGGARATLRSREAQLVACVYRSREAVVQVTVDGAPQAAARWNRWVVERGQAYLGAPSAELPEVLPGIGDGAAWVPAARELVATGRGRLVTIVMLRGGSAGVRPQATAVAAARAALAG